MTAQVFCPTVDLEGLVSEIRMSRKLSRQDQALLMALGSKLSLSDRQCNLLDQVYELLRQGLIRVVD